MNKINIGIVAHVDAGKTTVTENLLYLSGAIKEIGRVDTGSTTTDSMELERKRGITIKASAVSFYWKNVKINILDTPGHTDFISEVERSLSVLDGAVLVISAVEGIQAHTLLLFNTLKALKIPVIIFVNKIDRTGSDCKKLLKEMKEKFDKNIVGLQDVFDEGSASASLSPLYSDDTLDDIVDVLSNSDTRLLEDYLNGQTIQRRSIIRKTELCARKAKLFPVLYGSALKNIGIENLLDAITKYLPFSKGSEDSSLSAEVFKIDASSLRDKKVYIRLFSGRIKTRDSVIIHDNLEKITRIKALKSGEQVEDELLTAGDIGVVYGLKNARIGDIIGIQRSIRKVNMAEPTMKTRISAEDSDNRKLFEALTILSEEDPLLNVELGDFKNDIYVNLFGEVQMEILQSLLENNYGFNVKFSNVMTIYKETPQESSSAIIRINENGNPFRAGVGIRIAPLETGSGIKYVSEVSLGDLPKTFQNAVEEAVYDTLKQGILGWGVTDLNVIFTSSDYDSVTSTPSAFRDLTPMVLMEALNKAKTDLLEPLYEFQLTIPSEVCGKALADLSMLRAVFDNPVTNNEEILVHGLIPVNTSQKYKLAVASYTEGKGLFLTKFHGYQKISLRLGQAREKTKIDPLNKKMYLLHKLNAIR